MVAVSSTSNVRSLVLVAADVKLDGEVVCLATVVWVMFVVESVATCVIGCTEVGDEPVSLPKTGGAAELASADVGDVACVG